MKLEILKKLEFNMFEFPYVDAMLAGNLSFVTNVNALYGVKIVKKCEICRMDCPESTEDHGKDFLMSILFITCGQ